MLYDGNVVPGGPAQTLTTSALEISKISVGPMDNNAYLLRDLATGETLLIDAANEPDRLLELCGGKLGKVLTTHCHADHWLALEALVAATGATTYAAEPEVAEIPVTTDVVLADGDQIVLGNTVLEIRWLKGHRAAYLEHVSTSAAVVYHDPDGSVHVFAGDCLFPGGIGNTCEDPAAFSILLNDVANKLFARLPDNTRIHPGHGPDTTLGAERPHLGEWANRSW